MKTVCYCTSYFANAEAWNSRYMRWIEYYKDFDPANTQLVLIDDASPYTPSASQAVVVAPGQAIHANLPTIVRFPNRLGRNSMYSYPGWWRSFLHGVDIAQQAGATRLIHIESDAFLISERLKQYIKSCTSGWTVLWASRFNMPETAIQVICADQFDAMRQFQSKPQAELDSNIAEKLLPFTHINKDFVGERYGEFRVPLLRTGLLRSKKFNQLPFFQKDWFRERIPANADFATQVTPDQTIPVK